MLAIEVTLTDPMDAKNAADIIASEFKKVYGELNNSAVRQSREFIEGQLDTTRQSLVRGQDALRRFKEASGVTLLDQQSASAIQRLAQAKTDLYGAEGAYQAAKASIDKLNQEMNTLPQDFKSETAIARNPLWQDLTDQLYKLETQKAGMLGGGGRPGRGVNHPDVRALQQQIDDTKNQLLKEKPDCVAQTSIAKNPTRLGVLDRWMSAKVDEVSASARRKAVQATISDVRVELASLPAKEAKLAELQADVQAANQTYSLMRNKLDEAKIKEQQAKSEVTLNTVDPAYVVNVDQKKQVKLILAFLLSPLLGIGAAFLLYYTDNTVKTATEAEMLLGLPVYSVVPASRAHSLSRQNCPEIMDVAYQMLTSSLWIANQNQGANSIVLVSAEPDVGRSVTASNLAVALAREGARVVLVDADLRQPAQHLIFGSDNKVGLTNLLGGGATLEDVLVPTKVQGLLLVPSGPSPGNPVKLLRSTQMKEFAEQIKQVADFVIYDTPAGVTFPDAVLVAAHVGCAIVVHAAGKVPRGSEAEFRVKMESVGIQLLGAVLNKVRREDSSGYYHYRRSYQGVQIGSLSDGHKALKGSHGGKA